MNQLLDKFKAKDKFFMRISIGMQIFCWILIPLYFWMLVINPDPEILLNHRIGGFLYVISFAIFALIFNRKMKNFKEVDYSLPTVIMLEKAADRYKLCKPVLLAALIPIVLVDAGLILFSMDEWTMDDFVLHAIETQKFFIPLITVSFSIGIGIWYLKQKPLRDHALQLLKELKDS